MENVCNSQNLMMEIASHEKRSKINDKRERERERKREI